MAKSTLIELRRQFNNSTNTAIIAAFGFLVALSWKDLITEWVNRISLYSPIQGQIITTLIITLIAVVGIFVTTKIFSPKKSEVEAAEKKQESVGKK